MGIISEMRLAAQVSDGDTADLLKDWADRLAASGALVPVADGETRRLDSLGIQYFLHDEKLFSREEYRDGWKEFRVRGITEPDYVGFWEHDFFVQPVRLVPIQEAEI